jgi:hypothetical protein
MDIDEFVMPYHAVLHQAQLKTESFLDKFKTVVFGFEAPRLLFLKVFYLPYEVELKEIRKDSTRLRLLTAQLFRDIKAKKWPLSPKRFGAAVAIHALLQGSPTLHPDDFKAVLPAQLLQEQQAKLREHAEEVFAGLKGRVQAGNERSLGVALLNTLRDYRYFEYTNYFITLHEDTQRLLGEYGVEFQECMYLGIGPEEVVLLEPDSMRACLQISYTHIRRLEVYSCAVMLRVTNSRLDGEIRLRTEQPFEVSNVMNFYSELRKVLLGARGEV